MSDLTAKEQENVRAALRYLRVRWEKWENVAKSLDVSQATLTHVMAGATVTASLAFRVARRARATVDDVLTGKFPGICPHCGQTVPAQE